MAEIEEAFLRAALGVGLGGEIARLSAEVAEDLAAFPDSADPRHRRRLEDQQQSLRNPSLRTVAALVCGLCRRDADKAVAMAEAFEALAARHAHLAPFNRQVRDLAERAGAPLQRTG